VSAAIGAEAACSKVTFGRFRDQHRFQDRSRLGNTCVLGKGPAAGVEHIVARLEFRYVLADSFYFARHVHSERLDPWFALSEKQANDVRSALHGFPIKWIDGSRTDFYQDFAVFGNRLFEVLDLDNVWRPVSGISGFHAWTYGLLSPNVERSLRSH
jgi:hypothetical protein